MVHLILNLLCVVRCSWCSLRPSPTIAVFADACHIGSPAGFLISHFSGLPVHPAAGLFKNQAYLNASASPAANSSFGPVAHLLVQISGRGSFAWGKVGVSPSVRQPL
jgi:hypothetical protein